MDIPTTQEGYPSLKAALQTQGLTVFLDSIDPFNLLARCWPTPSQWIKLAPELAAMSLPDLPAPPIFSSPKLAAQYAQWLGQGFTPIPDGDGWAVVWHEDAVLV